YRVGEKEQLVTKHNEGLRTPETLSPKQPEAKHEEWSRVDFHGDSLPKGALARVGTTRFLQGARGGNSIAFTRDGKQILSIDGSRTVVFWDTATGKQTRRLEARD